MAEDQSGYLWLGTFQGLLRYDGLSTTRYNHHEADANSLSNNLIRAVHVTENDDLWVGTQSGLNRYSKQNDKFERFLTKEGGHQVIWGIFESPAGQLVVSTNNNLYLWDAATQAFIARLPADTQAIELKSAHFISETHLVVASYENGLFNINLVTGQVEAHSANANLIQDRVQLYQMTQVDQNALWLSSSEGIFTLNLNTNALSLHNSEQLTGKPIRAVHKATNGTLWLGSEQQILVSRNGQDFIPAQRVTPVNSGAAGEFIYDIVEDHYGNIWFGGPDLLAVRHASADMFKQHHLTALTANNAIANVKAVAASEQSIWLLTSYGILARWDPVTERIYEQTAIDINVSLNNHFRLVYDQPRNLIWIGSHDGLHSFSPLTKEFTHHQVEGNGQALSREFSFKLDSEGQIWIASKHYGLLRYSPEQQQTSAFAVPEPFNTSLNSLEISNSTILLGTEKGLLKFTPEGRTFNQVDLAALNQKWITAIKSINGSVWVGTLQAGAYRLNADLTQSQNFDLASGLADNGICDIVLKGNSAVWLVTNFGISQIQQQSTVLSTFTLANGVYNKEFNHQATSISPAGTAYVGGVDGLTSFNVSGAIDTKYRGQVQLTQLRVFNEIVDVNGPHKRLPANIRSLPTVNLLYQDSPFSIEFSYPTPAHGKMFNYAYRLVGLDDKWLTTDDDKPRATYTNLSPGEFNFEVKALSKDGLWQSEPTRLTIQVAPPLWRTPPAYLAYAIVIIILLMLFAKQRQARQEQQQKVIKSEERLKLSLWGSGDELWDWHISSGKIYRSNIWGLLEFPHDGRRSPQKGQQSNIHPRDLKRVQNALSNHFEGRTTFYEATYRVRNKSADWIWILDRGKIVERDTDNNPLRMTGTIKDISKLKQAEERLTLFARSVANISDGVFILNRRFRIVEINEAFSQITSFSKAQVMNRSLHFRSYPNSFSAQVKIRLAQQGRWVGELEELRAGGEPFFVELTIDPIHSEEGDVSHYVGVFSDITRRKQTEQELHRLSVEDTLTKLPNRSWFQAEHEKLVAKQTRHALMVLDLDNFKKINDSLGHVAGDELLQQVSIRLNDCTRRQDTLFRLGGDEYAVLMESTTDVNTITRAAKALQKSLEAPFAIAQRELVVTCSVGIVLYPLDGETSEELLRNADTAMYHAKSEGSNRYVFFSSQMNQSALHQLHLESLLRQAIRDDSFQLHYQPKFSSATGELDGMEALIRLHHPEHGPISPGEFIPLAEDNGLIIEIGDIVLRKACFAAESWRRQGLMQGRIAVNVSAKQFSSPSLPDRIKSALELTGLPAHFLELELTEGALIADPEGAIEVMQIMQEIGIHISLDDFGTGYSSLAYLQRFPIDTLKIDQTFVRNLTTSSSGRNMVASIVALAHNMNLTVVAEGVETEQERDILTELNCETLQGYLMSRPLNETDFSAFLHIQSNQADKSATQQVEQHKDYQAE
ncbi:EAL domain-containing protein [Neiella marina]|uniref:EAL domain-containing protein n=1 Tax=Neiella holothuriorum TaxID=2870530 RepID=A0ABS7EDN5_9GAMM|nr:EAL domain-containing protein [Neiella holothuriorum]MBW8190426.1 EAL domain-containing protein [Neiella holothuriorum]